MGYIPRSIPFLSRVMRHLMVIPWGAGLSANSSRSWTSTSTAGSGAVGLGAEAASYQGQNRSLSPGDPDQLKLVLWNPELLPDVVVKDKAGFLEVSLAHLAGLALGLATSFPPLPLPK